MSRGRKHKLWNYMRSVAHSPPPPRARGEMQLPPRKVTKADLEPLRDDIEWRPTRILARFGPAPNEREYLSRLIVACAVLQGAHRVLELTERLQTIMKNARPRTKRMLEEESLAPRKTVLEKVDKRIEEARLELVQTRARAANDFDDEPLNPDGLRFVDLAILTSHVRTAVLCHEVTTRRNLRGIDYGIAVISRAPDLAYAEAWVERALGSAKMNGILLYWPREYGRVLVVYDDGRLAYDPGATPEEDEG